MLSHSSTWLSQHAQFDLPMPQPCCLDQLQKLSSSLACKRLCLAAELAEVSSRSNCTGCLQRSCGCGNIPPLERIRSSCGATVGCLPTNCCSRRVLASRESNGTVCRRTPRIHSWYVRSHNSSLHTRFPGIRNVRSQHAFVTDHPAEQSFHSARCQCKRSCTCNN